MTTYLSVTELHEALTLRDLSDVAQGPMPCRSFLPRDSCPRQILGYRCTDGTHQPAGVSQ